MAQGRDVVRRATPASGGPRIELVGPAGAEMPASGGHRAGRLTPRLGPKVSGSVERRAIRVGNEVARRPRPAGTAPASTATTIVGLSQIANSSNPGWGSPPDTNLARGPARLVHVVNRRVRLYTTAGGVLQTTDLNRFFGALTAAGVPSANSNDWLFDPKVIYDGNATRPRFYVVALQGNGSTAFSRLWLAVSRSPNPSSLRSGEWCRYRIDMRHVLSFQESWADYPGLGVGRDGLVVTTNQFTRGTSPSFVGSAILAWNKLRLNANALGCPVRSPVRWESYSPDGTNVFALPFTLQPAVHPDRPTSVAGAVNPIYLLHTDPNATTYGVWRVGNLASTDPLLWGPLVLTGSFLNALPGSAPNGAGGLIDTGDVRMLQVGARGDRLAGVHTVNCFFPGDGVADTCMRLIDVLVGSTAAGGMTAALSREVVTGGGDGWHYFYPSVAINAAGVAVSAIEATGPDGRLGAAYAVLQPGAAAHEQPVWLMPGTCARDATFQASRGFNRAGDYSGASVDPDGVRVWLATERARSIPGVGCGWQTVIGAVTP
jgi:hypothetical protein